MPTCIIDADAYTAAGQNETRTVAVNGVEKSYPVGQPFKASQEEAAYLIGTHLKVRVLDPADDEPTAIPAPARPRPNRR